MREKSRRKTMLIDPDFQLKFIFFNFLNAIFVSLAIYGANTFFLYRMKKLGVDAGLSPDSTYYTLIDQQSEFLGAALMISVVVASTVIILFSLTISHRMAGPIHNIKSNLRDRINNKKFRPFKVRKNDFFSDLADLMDQYDQEVNKVNPKLQEPPPPDRKE